MTSSSERLLLSIALGTALAVCGYYCSKLVSRRSNGRRKSLAAVRLAAAPRQSLRKLQSSGHWVALCGTAFDVNGDPFFDATCCGVYSSWVNHDVTYLLLQLGLVLDATDNAEAISSYLDREWQLDTLTGDNEEARRRRALLQEWFVRRIKKTKKKKKKRRRREWAVMTELACSFGFCVSRRNRNDVLI